MLTPTSAVSKPPGERVDVDTEIARLVPLIEWVPRCLPDADDTWRVAARLRGGGDLGSTTPGVASTRPCPEVAAEFGVAWCAHTGGARTRPWVSYGTTACSGGQPGSAKPPPGAGPSRRGGPGEKSWIDPAHDFGKNTFMGVATRPSRLSDSGGPC